MSEYKNEVTVRPSISEGSVSLPACINGKFEIEHPEDRAARLSREDLEAKDGRVRKQALYFVLLGMYVLMFLVFGAISICCTDPAMTAWARPIFSSLFAGVVGFVAGKAKSV
jgi:hypothetical protein